MDTPQSIKEYASECIGRGQEAFYTTIALVAPTASYVFYSFGNWTVVSGVVLLLSVLFLAMSRQNTEPPRKFLSSGKTAPATFSQELLLKRKGGKGSAYWCDPDVAFASLSDFKFTLSKKVDFANLLKEKGNVISPYCVDDETRSVVFVELEPGLDPAEKGPFFFQTQRNNALRLYTVPFDEYHKVISELDDEMCSTEKLLLVYNVSRCGSTILSKCLNQLGEVRSISEPDIFSSLTHLASEANGTRNEDLKKLAQSSARLMCYQRRLLYPDCDTVCIKFRFQMVYIADLVKEAIPDAKAIFLYRNALDVIDSMAAAFINTRLYHLVRRLGVDVFYVFKISDLPQNLPKLMPLMNDERFPVETYKDLGAVCPFVMSWLSVMHYGMKGLDSGSIQAAIRYEELTARKTDLVSEMLGVVGLPLKSSTQKKQDGVFTKDAHGESITRSRRAQYDKNGVAKRGDYVYFRGDDVRRVKQVLARHEVIENSEFIIPGTLSTPLANVR